MDEWIEDLIEVDALLAGLACSLLGGEKVVQNQIPEISTLQEAFINMTLEKKFNIKVLDQCQSYLDLLARLHEQLLVSAKRKGPGLGR
ncbi:MAG: hypothetical protein K940chlam7_01271 [Chlamydiae bacterium]|nr:hypothetical protein [Chlamydiota bacterium]